jgi:hypothetical protein
MGLNGATQHGAIYTQTCYDSGNGAGVCTHYCGTKCRDFANHISYPNYKACLGHDCVDPFNCAKGKCTDYPRGTPNCGNGAFGVQGCVDGLVECVPFDLGPKACTGNTAVCGTHNGVPAVACVNPQTYTACTGQPASLGVFWGVVS